MIETKWFTKSQIAKAFGITRKEAESLCDKTSSGRANGGYGMNILSKESGMDLWSRKYAIVKLEKVSR